MATRNKELVKISNLDEGVEYSSVLKLFLQFFHREDARMEKMVNHLDSMLKKHDSKQKKLGEDIFAKFFEALDPIAVAMVEGSMKENRKKLDGDSDEAKILISQLPKVIDRLNRLFKVNLR